MDLDILYIVGTHLVDTQELTINGYTWIGHNRVDLDPKAVRGSGGVGILIKKLYSEQLRYKTHRQNI